MSTGTTAPIALTPVLLSSHGSGSDHHRINCFSVSQTAQGRQTRGKNTTHKPTAAKLILSSLVFPCTQFSVAQKSREPMQNQTGRISWEKLLTRLHQTKAGERRQGKRPQAPARTDSRVICLTVEKFQGHAFYHTDL